MAGPEYSEPGDTYPGPIGLGSVLSTLSEEGTVSSVGSITAAAWPGQ